MSMAFMVAAASRKRDSRGRYMDAPDNRMDGGYDRPEGNYARMNDQPEMRRRRDSRGRYMEGDEGPHMGYADGNYSRMDNEPEMRRRRDSRGRYMEAEPSAHYMPWPEPHIPPYLNEPEMRDERNVQPGRERRGSVELEYEPTHMRDRNIVNIRDYQDKRRIGFGENRMHMDDQSHERREDHQHYSEGDAHHMGAYPMTEQLTNEIATAWVDSMKNADPEHPNGAKWSKETTKSLAIKHGFNTPESQLEFWAVMNMMYSDYAETAKKHNVSTMDFYADMAKAWMRDKDGVKHKTAAYIACCTE